LNPVCGLEGSALIPFAMTLDRVWKLAPFHCAPNCKRSGARFGACEPDTSAGWCVQAFSAKREASRIVVIHPLGTCRLCSAREALRARGHGPHVSCWRHSDQGWGEARENTKGPQNRHPKTRQTPLLFSSQSDPRPHVRHSFMEVHLLNYDRFASSLCSVLRRDILI
jgi:hypothetical protein